MAQPDRPHPVDDVWTAAVHTGDSSAPVGAAVVIDERRLLTCAHVVLTDGRVRAGLTVTFPKAVDAWGQRRAVAEVRLAAPTGVVDLAVLLLAEAVPDGVLAAPVRCPRPVDLVGRRWSAFGFPNGQPAGNGADGTVGLHLGHGLVRLDTSSRYVVEPGFSGGGLWSPEYEAVVGLVVRANERGDGQALTLFAADRYAPGERLRALAEWSLPAAGEVAIAAWGWALGTDPEGRRHWRPRARGVTVDSERGYRFRGRTSALSAIVHWLDRAEPDRQVLVVTGSPGVGKSAVLGRVVTTADAEIRASSPVDDPAVRATVGSVACAVHVKGKTALEVAGEVARAASAPLPEMLGDFAPALRDALAARGGTRFNVVVDALDESTSPAETREIISSVLLPLAQSCADVGAQVVVGTRRRDDAGDLLALLGPGARVVDLDAAEFFAAPDLAAYVQATLQLVGDERDDNPYAAAEVAVPVAARIAELAEGNFLVGGLVARAHGLFDPVPVPLEHVTFTSTVDAALDRYLERVPPLGRVPARLVLTVLAYAEAPGLPIELWQSGLAALGAEVGTEELSRFAHSSAANFLVESGTDRGATAFRLFHQALNDALLRGRAASAAPPDDRQRLVRAWLAYGRSTSWESAPGYLLRSLPSHALAAGLLDELLNDDSYLLHADLLRVLLVANNATTERGRARARMLRLTPEAQQGGPERAAMFSVTQELDHLAAGFTATAGAPYTSRWSASRVRHEYAVLEGHIGAVLAVCAVPVGDRALLASAGSDHTLRLWDPATGLVERLLEGHTHGVAGLSVVPVDGRVLLASAGHDGTVRLWDPESGLPERVLEGHRRRVRGVCVVPIDDRVLLASAGQDGTVRLWDPVSGRAERVVEADPTGVLAVCPVRVDGRVQLASAGSDGTVRLWDPASGELERTLAQVVGSDADWVEGICAIPVGGRELLASAGSDGTVRLWDPATGGLDLALEGHPAGALAVCAVPVDGRLLLASAGFDGTVRLWDPASGRPEATFEAHSNGVQAICAMPAGSRVLLVSGGISGVVRLWDPVADQIERRLGWHTRSVTGMCAVPVAGRMLLASASNDKTVRLWEAGTGRLVRVLAGHTDELSGVCAVPLDGRTLLASAGGDYTVRLWDPVTGRPERVLQGHTSWVNGVCAVPVADRVLLGSASSDGTARLWDATTGQPERELAGHISGATGLCAIAIQAQTVVAVAGGDGRVSLWDAVTGRPERVLGGHTREVSAVCVVPLAGRALLGTASFDGTVRLWDPVTGRPERVLAGHTDRVTGLCAVPVAGRILLASASVDQTVRLWDPVTGRLEVTIPTHHAARSCSYADGLLFVGLSSGLLALDVSGLRRVG